MQNQVMDAILTRSSIRAYKDSPLTAEQLDALKAAALASPTAMNRRQQRFVFITNKAVIAKLETATLESIKNSGNTAFYERILERGGKPLYAPPLIVLIFAAEGRFAPVDAGIAVENLALAAKSLGLDSVILGMPAAALEGEGGADLVASFGIESGYSFMIGIAIGNRAAEKTPHESDPSHIIRIG